MEKEDLQRKKERLELLHQMLKQEFGEYEELPRGEKYGAGWEAAVAIEHPSGKSRVILTLTSELLTDEGISFETRFREGIERAKRYINKAEGKLIVLQLLTDQIRKIHED